MLSFLYKVLRFWRRRGAVALFHILLFKINRTRMMVKADLRIGRPRGKSAKELVAERFVACAPLRVFRIPPADPARITVITDSINSGSLYGGVGTAMIMAALLAESRQARLRIVTRTKRAMPDNLEHVLSVYGTALTHEVEFAFAPSNDGLSEIDVFDNELFITTSWWTTAATMASVPHRSIVYLLQEDERMFYPYGDDRVRCERILSSDSIEFVVNTRLLFDHLVDSGLRNIAARGTWFEPAFPRDVFFPRKAAESGKRRLMFYARPNNMRNLFYFGMEVIEEAMTREIIDLDEWEVVLVGKDVPDVTFLNGYAPKVMEDLKWSEYADLAGTIDLGLCLMCTPHPSYPPLDLAASGAAVVTNRFEGKTDLGGYSKNIICADLDRESMLAAIADGIRLAKNAAERGENHRSSRMPSDWRATLSEVISRVGKNA